VSTFCTITRLLRGGILVAALACAPALALAQEAPALPQEAEEPPAQVLARMSAHTLAPELTETGEPVLDEAGAPVFRQVALEDSILVPGETVIFVVTLENPTPDVLEDLVIGAPLAPEVRLDPFSIASIGLLTVEWADVETPDVFSPLFERVDGEDVLQADPDTIAALRLGVAALAPKEALDLSYSVTLR
jgi:hypothetical protein